MLSSPAYVTIVLNAGREGGPVWGEHSLVPPPCALLDEEPCPGAPGPSLHLASGPWLVSGPDSLVPSSLSRAQGISHHAA